MREQNIAMRRMSVAGTARAFAADLLGYARRDAVKAASLVLAGALVEGLGLVMLIPLFSIILGAWGSVGGMGEFADALVRLLPVSERVDRLLLLLTGFALLIAVRGVVLVKRDVLLARLLIGFIHRKRVGIIDLLANSRWETVARLRHGRITHILGSDIHNLRSAAHFLIQGAVAAVMLAVQIVLALLVSFPLTGLVLLLALTGAAALGPALKKSHRLGTVVTDANLNLVNNTTQFLGGLKLALSQDLQQSFVREFDEGLSQASERETEFARQRALTGVTLAGFAAAVAAIVLLTGVTAIDTPAPALIALLVILARMNGPATILQSGAQQILHSLPAYAKIRQLEVDLGAARLDRHEAPIPPQPLSGPIEVSGGTYRHRERASGREGVFDVNIRIEEGSFVGLTGPSGAGKTTFADLLAGLYPPDQGMVSVGGLPLEGETLRRWRASLSYVAQDPFLFHDSIRRNLLWARPDAAEEDVWDSLAKAGAADLVRGMADGLDTLVGERGALLSGGERQRIALARALIRKPRLLLLDEATNAIDAEGEREILARLAASPDRPTIVLSAHRQSSLDMCERLIEFSEGVVVCDVARHG